MTAMAAKTARCLLALANEAAWHLSTCLMQRMLFEPVAADRLRVTQAEQAEALSDEAKALVEEQAGSLYGKTHNRSGMRLAAAGRTAAEASQACLILQPWRSCSIAMCVQRNQPSLL
jgi:hypothetical protein